MQYMSEVDCVSKLVGDIPADEMQCTLLDFWARFAKENPSHELLDAANRKQATLSRTIPCYVHGDEGRGYKKTGIMCLSLQGIIGRGSRPFRKKVIKIWRKKLQGLNLGGNSLHSRLLMAAVPKKFYNKKPHVYKKLFDTLIGDLSQLERSGFTWRERTWYIQVLGLKGDLPFLTKTADLDRHYLRKSRTAGGKSPGMCFLCHAGQPGIPFEDFTNKATWFQAPCSPPWRTEPSFLQLRLMRESPQTFLKTDLFHNLHGGAGKDFCASALVEICTHLVLSGTIQERCQAVNAWLHEFVALPGQKMPHSGGFDGKTVGFSSYQVLPDAVWSKHDDTTVYLRFLEHLLRTHGERTFRNPILSKIYSATCAINQALSRLFSGGLWLPKEDALEIAALGRQFLLDYQWLAQQSFTDGKLRFPLSSKLHYMDHGFRWMESCAQRNSYIFNIVAESNQQDEDSW